MRFVLSLLVALAATPALALSENDVRDCLCTGETEVHLPSGARADCVQDGFAIEVDATENWAEAIGQSLHYASTLKLKAKVILFCRRSPYLCYQHQLRFEQTVSDFALPIALALEDGASVAAACAAARTAHLR